MRFFNTAGPVNPENHYYVPHRLNANELQQLIDQKKYFVLHAPRQSGKTTVLLKFVSEINEASKYQALYVNVEPAQVTRGNVHEGMKTILQLFLIAILQQIPNSQNLTKHLTELIQSSTPPAAMLLTFLSHWATVSLKPLILFIDEIDSLIGDTLISVLRQLRAGYSSRPHAFPQTVCLVGVRDVRDYRIWSEQEQSMVLGGSAFNIKAESLILPNFSREQVRNLYEQHTKETGQQFTDEALEYAFYLTQGQPWLVNALAYQACFRNITDRSCAITKNIIEQAKETLILRRDTHIDVLVDRLHEPRVRSIIDAIINGDQESLDVSTDDIAYVCDLGLIAKKEKILCIANPIYQEIIPRELSYALQATIVQKTIWYQNPDGSLNMHKVLQAFQQFYREHSEIWIERNSYKESAPHIIMMAFLQRIVNGGGKIHREYALGRKRVDISIEWPAGNQRIVVELKIKRSQESLEKGLKQTAEYMDKANATEGYLVIFDPSDTKSWDEKIFTQSHTVEGKTIPVWGA
ncbi:AAA-like domain-containing protein [Candidatus Dependentiae bacterium]|nr:AAA-like domain-containing protein [Candidatus Dependentiae bacterium]